MRTQQIDIETYASECCLAPMEDGICMKCGKQVGDDYRSIMIRGVTKASRTSADVIGEWFIIAMPTILWITIGLTAGIVIGSSL